MHNIVDTVNSTQDLTLDDLRTPIYAINAITINSTDQLYILLVINISPILLMAVIPNMKTPQASHPYSLLILVHDIPIKRTNGKSDNSFVRYSMSIDTCNVLNKPLKAIKIR